MVTLNITVRDSLTSVAQSVLIMNCVNFTIYQGQYSETLKAINVTLLYAVRLPNNRVSLMSRVFILNDVTLPDM
jgi:hypothetical protein